MIVGKSLAYTARLHPDRAAIVFEGQVWTHRQLHERVNKLADALTSRGLVKGNRIAVLSRNSNRYLEISFALGLMGVCMVPINHRLRPAEVETRLEHADIHGAFIEPEFESVLGEMQPELTARLTGRTIILDDHKGEQDNYEVILSSGRNVEVQTVVKPHDPLYLGYTSGTTGRAKAAIVSHQAIVVGYLYKTLLYDFRSEEVSLNPGYFWHSAPRDFAQLQIYLGGTSVVMRDFKPRECLNLMEEHKVTNGFFVPTMFRMMLECDEFAGCDLSSLRLMLSGGAPLPTRLKSDVLEKFGPIVHEFYAATETRIVSSIGPEELKRKTRSVGRPARDIDLRILDTDGNQVATGEIGEIYLRTPTIFSGYFNDPQKTADAHRDDWFTLGDMGKLDDDGYLYLVDRRHDMVISGGENIFPSEIEDVLQHHPAISDVAVFGVPDMKWGEALKAAVCLRPGCSVTEEELTAYCAQHLADYLKPRSYDFLDELPRNPTGKVLKRVLREAYWGDGEAKV